MTDAHPVIYTVSQLNGYVKSIFENDDNLRYVYLCGEISNFTNHRTGHLYFTLKDENSTIRAVMFSRNADRLRFLPQNSMKVIVFGRVSVYEPSGQYQFYVENMQPDGVGALAMAFEQLKEKLFNEGLFDAAHKKPIPLYPEKIGVITSPTGAAVEDIRNILSRRFKYSSVFLYPALVQGDGAEEDLCKGIRYFNKKHAVDVIIIGRGGGSQEDLWAFNSEKLAREVYASEIPVISAVGHETDYTIIDFVSDLRAETPSAAAEYAVPDSNEQLIYLESVKNSLATLVRIKLGKEKQRLDRMNSAQILKAPLRSVEIRQLKLDSLFESLIAIQQNRLKNMRTVLSSDAARLNALSPLNTISRGYSVTFKDGKIIKSVADINKGDSLRLRLSDGEAACTVEEIL